MGRINTGCLGEKAWLITNKRNIKREMGLGQMDVNLNGAANLLDHQEFILFFEALNGC